MNIEKVFIDVGEEMPYQNITDVSQLKRNQVINAICLTETNSGMLVPKKELFVSEGNKLHGASIIDRTYQVIRQNFSKFPPNKIFYSVVNRNTAHQISYFLAQYAFENFGVEGNEKIVINIDQHEDFGLVVSSPVKFSSWGRNITDKSFLDVLKSSKAIYNVIGLQVPSTSEETEIKSKIKQLDLSKSSGLISNEKNFKINSTNLSKEIINYIFDEKIKNGPTSMSKSDIYISFDTDAMKESNTCYKSGILESHQIIGIIKEILNIIKTYSGKLVGVDITGLPIRDSICSNDCKTYDNAFEKTKTIINIIEQELISF